MSKEIIEYHKFKNYNLQKQTILINYLNDRKGEAPKNLWHLGQDCTSSSSNVLYMQSLQTKNLMI